MLLTGSALRRMAPPPPNAVVDATTVIHTVGSRVWIPDVEESWAKVRVAQLLACAYATEHAPSAPLSALTLLQRRGRRACNLRAPAPWPPKTTSACDRLCNVQAEVQKVQDDGTLLVVHEGSGELLKVDPAKAPLQNSDSRGVEVCCCTVLQCTVPACFCSPLTPASYPA